MPTADSPVEEQRYILWIDGIGAYLVCLGSKVTIGGQRIDGEAADVALLANLSRIHATLVRSREGYYLQAHSPVRVAGRQVDDKTALNNGYEIVLGSNVKLKFRLPTVLSATATLDFVSDHRPSRSVDGVILMDENCLLGPGGENHIRCLDWTDSVLLYRKDGHFCCKSRSDLFVGTSLLRDGAPIVPGDVVSGSDIRFRLERADF